MGCGHTDHGNQHGPREHGAYPPPDHDHEHGEHADANGDRIFNGAVDNATGTAGLLELARVFGAGPRPERSIVMISFTAEESGLLGSEFYAANPIYPLETTVAGFNIDAMNVYGRVSGVDVIEGFEIWDRIDVSAIDAMPQFAGNQAFLFTGSGFIPGLPGQLRGYVSGGNTFVELEVTGDGMQDFMMMIEGAHVLTAQNFVF